MKGVKYVIPEISALDIISSSKEKNGEFSFYFDTTELSKEYILGTRAYMDTSTAQSFTDPDKLVEIIRQHGTGKILFGSDFPILYTHEAAKELYLIF